jgi:catechol 2,3-dioxygenase-like lactoylglutathione lyase family enzyme
MNEAAHEPSALLDVSPLWPAELDHLRIDSPDPQALADFYARAMGMATTPLGADLYQVEGLERRLVIGRGAARGHPWSAFALGDTTQLRQYRQFLEERGAELLPSPTPLFAERAFGVRDPDGRIAAFGLAHEAATRGTRAGHAAALPGRLQHVVVASAGFGEMMRFYRDVLGFLVSDTVHVDDGKGGIGDANVCFLRASEEHHCFAVFRAPRSASDHFAFEVPSWDAMKPWADHFASLEVPIWWGPGRHGAGNNLFFMVRDPDGNNIEISAELEWLAKGAPGKRWPAGGEALNLWGPAWVRDTEPG